MKPDPRQSLAWHYHLQRGLYCRQQSELKDAILVSDPELADPEWNHAALLDVEASELPTLLTKVSKQLAKLDRPARVVLDPTTASLRPKLEALGWHPIFTHDWVFFLPLSKRGEQRELRSTTVDDDFHVSIVRDEKQMQSFIEIFFAGFGAVDGDLDPGHAGALWQSFNAPPEDLDVVHFLGHLGNRPVAIGTVIHGRAMGKFRSASGFYNLAVRPEVRGQGWGERLNRVRLDQAIAWRSELIFLQTASPRLAEWHRRHGWTLGFQVQGYESG